MKDFKSTFTSLIGLLIIFCFIIFYNNSEQVDDIKKINDWETIFNGEDFEDKVKVAGDFDNSETHGLKRKMDDTSREKKEDELKELKKELEKSMLTENYLTNIFLVNFIIFKLHDHLI